MKTGRERTWIKAVLAGAGAWSGALRMHSLARLRASGPTVRVLGLHRVVDDLDTLGPEAVPAMAITSSSLARLCSAAKKQFDVLPLASAAQVLTGQRRASRDVLVITFDDGYRDVYLRALPILRALDLPATVFVPTGYIGSPDPLPHDRLHALLAHAGIHRVDLIAASLRPEVRRILAFAERILHRDGSGPALGCLIGELPGPALAGIADALEELLGLTIVASEGARVMSREELAACVAGGMELGAHTVDHVVLTRESPARLRRELGRPRVDLAEIAGVPCTSFAYCNGLWSPSVVEAVRDAGYRAAVTTCDRPNREGVADVLVLGRKVLHEDHVRGPSGRYSPSLAEAQLHDLFGTLGLSAREAETREAVNLSTEELAWRPFA